MTDKPLTDAQLKVLAAWLEDGPAWYEAPEFAGWPDSRAEFELLREVATDLIDAREQVRTLREALRGFVEYPAIEHYVGTLVADAGIRALAATEPKP
jgi:hypothetical protein